MNNLTELLQHAVDLSLTRAWDSCNCDLCQTRREAEESEKKCNELARQHAEEKEMAKPWIHAESSAKRFGGVPEDYIEIHNLMDSSKSCMSDVRHRALTHNAWFVGYILEKIFGVTITNSDGKKVSVRDIGEQHVAEDFGMRFIPTAQDWLAELEFKEWMMAGKGEPPPSYKKLDRPKLGGEKRTVMSLKD